ncbi:hypothetical protein BSZ19_48250 [Bradyrhizobium japonicum]|uniref:Uncharacterized protein n=1 Tax=Bradyrhizobium japonicum TaxID=375 RepID=A0A1Y2J9A7_BRAJP|nr:hypothetical protein BSZ19_48250 [Bradyrhizobium japonicum]
MLVAAEGCTKIVFAIPASLGTHGAVQLDQDHHKATSFLAANLQIGNREKSCAAFVEFAEGNIQAALTGSPGHALAAEVPLNGIDDRLHSPARLLLFVAIRRYMTQSAPDGLPVQLQHVGGAECGN